MLIIEKGLFYGKFSRNDKDVNVHVHYAIMSVLSLSSLTLKFSTQKEKEN